VFAGRIDRCLFANAVTGTRGVEKMMKRVTFRLHLCILGAIGIVAACTHVTKPEHAVIYAQPENESELGHDPKHDPEHALKHEHGPKHKACNENDVKLGINPHNHKFPSQMDGCASPSWGGIKETGECIKKLYPGLTENCRMCFAKMAHCSAEHCKLACMINHMGDSCLRCSESSCEEHRKDGEFSLETCTGLEESQLPPKK